MRIDPPRALGLGRERVYFGVGALVIAGMLIALVFGDCCQGVCQHAQFAV